MPRNGVQVTGSGRMATKGPKIPNFHKATEVLRKAPDVARTMLAKTADMEAETFIHYVENQTPFEEFDAAPLSEKWAAFKKKHKLDKRTMIATTHYINKVRVFTTRVSPTHWQYRIGFAPSDRAIDPVTKTQTPLSLNLLAAVHEYGSQKAHVPARPHWGPFFDEMEKRAKIFPKTVVAKILGGKVT